MATNSLADISLDQIEDFVENGIVGEENSEIVSYMLEMDKVRGMHLRIKEFGSKEAIMRHLMKVDGLSRYQANKLYTQAIEYFYCDTTISKAAWRNVYAEKMEATVNFAIAAMKDTADAAKVNKMILEMAKVRQLDQPDKEEVPDQEVPWKMYSQKPEDVGLPKIDRRIIARMIDEKMPELSDRDRIMLKEEAGILPLNAWRLESEDPRKNA